MKDKTIFEKIIDRELISNIVYEDEKNIAFLDAFPFEKGHLLVVPKKAYETVWNMPENEYIDLQKVVLKLTKKMYKKMKCGINIIENNLSIADQEVPHVHFHIIPRMDKKRKMFLDAEEIKYCNDNEKKEFEDKLRLN